MYLDVNFLDKPNGKILGSLKNQACFAGVSSAQIGEATYMRTKMQAPNGLSEKVKPTIKKIVPFLDDMFPGVFDTKALIKEMLNKNTFTVPCDREQDCFTIFAGLTYLRYFWESPSVVVAFDYLLDKFPKVDKLPLLVLAHSYAYGNEYYGGVHGYLSGGMVNYIPEDMKLVELVKKGKSVSETIGKKGHVRIIILNSIFNDTYVKTKTQLDVLEKDKWDKFSADCLKGIAV